MIDIHSHILPGLDDGARDLEQSLKLARQAVREGIHTVIATPHHRNGRYDNPGGAVRQAAEALARELAAAGIPLKLRCGQEIRVYAELPEDLERGEALTLNGSRYLLLELPSGYVPQGMDELLHELRVMGRVPVIAHPERNRELAADPGRLAAWVRQGVLLQLTSHSVSGALGPRLARLCLDWCRRNLVHFIASDAHHPDSRGFSLADAYERIAAAAGEDCASRLRSNALALAEDLPIEPGEPRPNRGRFLFWKWHT